MLAPSTVSVFIFNRPCTHAKPVGHGPADAADIVARVGVAHHHGGHGTLTLGGLQPRQGNAGQFWAVGGRRRWCRESSGSCHRSMRAKRLNRQQGNTTKAPMISAFDSYSLYGKAL